MSPAIKRQTCGRELDRKLPLRVLCSPDQCRFRWWSPAWLRAARSLGSATLKPGAREKLARVAGILLSHPDLKLQIEGHTDSVGDADYNQRLSDNRADSVRAYLVAQGIASTSVTTAGLGETQPVASNDTPAGRQQNRRVELVVAGEAIGTTAARNTR
jgi:hypothetical protein